MNNSVAVVLALSQGFNRNWIKKLEGIECYWDWKAGAIIPLMHHSKTSVTQQFIIEYEKVAEVKSLY